MSLYIPKMSDTPAITIPGLAGNFETLSPLLAWDGPISIPCMNGWSESVQIIKNGLGQVYIYGHLTVGSISTGTIVAELPEGFAPLAAAHPLPAINVSNPNNSNVTGLSVLRSQNAIYIYRFQGASQGEGIRFGSLYQT